MGRFDTPSGYMVGGVRQWSVVSDQWSERQLSAISFLLGVRRLLLGAFAVRRSGRRGGEILLFSKIIPLTKGAAEVSNDT